jgi:glycerol-3-phosphate dehydrogenase (NAD(P)+)
LGENARAAVVTRALAEISRLAVALGGRAETVSGLSGLGDLMLTCAGASSRNYRLGLAIGGGADPVTARRAMVEAVEGVEAAPALLIRAAGVSCPVTEGVAAVLAGRKSVAEALAEVLARPEREE